MTDRGLQREQINATPDRFAWHASGAACADAGARRLAGPARALPTFIECLDGDSLISIYAHRKAALFVIVANCHRGL